MSPSHNTAADELPVIEVKNLTKEYRLGALEGLRATAKRLLGRAPDAPKRQFKALDDVSFSVKRGEVVGIIGHNGAGKSTLLKHLCQITTPTSGSVTVRGRVAPLIEVGAGLVGDMTGRENIYLNASILGLSRAEIEGKVDEIIQFAELEQFIDTPAKRYSSGMQVRLGFSIATAVVPDVLIVDEVLAVGDVAFQRKCIERMDAFRRDPSKTLLIVGHNIRQLERVCTRMILLERGTVILDDEPNRVSEFFYRRTTASTQVENAVAISSGRDAADISSVSVKVESHEMAENSGVDGAERVGCERPIRLSITVNACVAVADAEINVGIHNPELVFVVKASTRMFERRFDLAVGANVFVVELPAIRVVPGIYGIGVGVYDRLRRPIFGATGVKWLSAELELRKFSDLPQGTMAFCDANWSVEV
jgi:lipopolysaccharide transport system ATP-binding protein